MKSERERRSDGTATVLGREVSAACKWLMIAVTLWSSGGCYLTAAMWQTAVRPVHQSKATGLAEGKSGQSKALLSFSKCEEREDGWYSCDIPANWRQLPAQISMYGSDIVEIPDVRPAAIRPFSPSEEERVRGFVEIDFKDVALDIVPADFDEDRDFGLAYGWTKDGFAAHIFGYDRRNARWVRLREIPIDVPRTDEGSIAGAVIGTPFTVAIDGVCWAAAALGVLAVAGSAFQGGGGCGSLPEGPEPPRQPIEFQIRQLVLKISTERYAPALVNMVRELASFGMAAKSTVPRLKGLLEHPDGLVRLEVADALWELCRNDRELYLPVVADVLETGSPRARRKAVADIVRHRVEDAVPHLVRRLAKDGDSEVRQGAISALAAFRNTNAVPALAAAAGDRDVRIQRAAIRALGVFESRDAASAVAAALNDSNAHVRREAASTLGEMGLAAQDTVAALNAASNDTSYRVRRAVKYALRKVQ